MVTIKRLDDLEKELHEGWRSCGVRMAFANSDNQQVTQFVSCKDYMQDAIMATLRHKPVSIYGFKYNPDEHPALDLEATRILIKFSKGYEKKSFEVLDLINQIESELGLEMTQRFDTDDPNIVLYVGPKDWMLSTVTISLYTLLFRLGVVHPFGQNWRNTLKGIISGEIADITGADHNLAKAIVPAIDGWKKFGGLTKVFGESQELNFTCKQLIYKDDREFHDGSGLDNYYRHRLNRISHWKFLEDKPVDDNDPDYYDEDDE